MVRRMAPVKGLSDSHSCHGARVTRVNFVACVPADAGHLVRQVMTIACVVAFFRRCPR